MALRMSMVSDISSQHNTLFIPSNFIHTMSAIHAHNANLFTAAVAHEATMKKLDLVDYRFYNSLPVVSEADKMAKGLDAVRVKLFEIIEKHKLTEILSVRLIHKHFDMQPGEVATFQTVTIPGICGAVMMGPIKPNASTQLLGKNFAVDANGNWVAYELTTDESTGGDVSLYPAFAKEAAEYLVNAAGRTVFGLSWEPIKEDIHLTEFEIPDKRSTIMVPSELFPADSTDVVIQTNWFAPMYNCALGCKETRSGLHYGCKKTRSDHHYGSRRIMDKAKDAPSDGSFEELSDDDAPFWKALQDPNSQFFKIVDYVTSVM
ncbi:hypothetical protein ACEPAI_348 [Sanghuangporus weigelae]